MTDVVLILGAVNFKTVQWSLVTSVVKGRFINVYSWDDWVLKHLFGIVSENPIGITDLVQDKVENLDVTKLCSEKIARYQVQHLAARELIKKIFKILELDP